MEDFNRDANEIRKLFKKWALVPLRTAAKIIGISHPTLLDRIKKGKVNSIKMGHVHYVSIIQEEDANRSD